MAKALYGHVGAAPDRRLLDEVTRLRSRVQSLEFEVTRLRAENDRLAVGADVIVAATDRLASLRPAAWLQTREPRPRSYRRSSC